MKLITATNKATNEKYEIGVKQSWGKTYYSLDGDVWHRSARAAREANPEAYARAVQLAKLFSERAA